MLSRSPARFLALPFVLYAILFMANGYYETSTIHTLAFMASIIILVLLYVFQYQINEKYWKRNPPPLDMKLKSWMTHHSNFAKSLSPEDLGRFEKRISLFVKVKNFTLKGEKDYELEEDSKCLIAHEFQRLIFGREDFLYNELNQIVVYNHPFPTPNIEQLHAAEIYSEDGVIILSREQLINGFFDPTQVNIALLLAIMAFVESNPRLEYPKVADINIEDFLVAHDLQLEPFKVILGVDHIKTMDILLYCYSALPDRFQEWNKDLFCQLEGIFGLAKKQSK
ncbi:MAG: hypothetical protein ACJA01_003976 [Saprospiraceae bacterium]|jgi:hypothetical protein